MTTTLKENFLNVFNGIKTGKTPVLPITTITLMSYREKVKSDFPEAHTDSNKMVKLATAPYEFSGIEGINIPFDMTIESEAIGCSVDLKSGDQTPEVIKSPFKIPSDIKIPDNFLEKGRMPVLFNAIDNIEENYPNVPLIIGIVGPFTLLGQLLGIENLLKQVKMNIFEVEDALTVVNDALIGFSKKLSSLKVDAICVCEPSCSSDLLNPDIFEKIVKPELEILANEISVKSILHVCGNSNPIIPGMLSCGFDAISIEDVVDINYINDVKKELNLSTLVCGNISTNKALLLGTPQEVMDEVKIALKKGVDVLCSSCSVPPHSPEDNVNAMVVARDEFEKSL